MSVLSYMNTNCNQSKYLLLQFASIAYYLSTWILMGRNIAFTGNIWLPISIGIKYKFVKGISWCPGPMSKPYMFQEVLL